MPSLNTDGPSTHDRKVYGQFHKQRISDNNRRRVGLRYGLTPNEYDGMFIEQDGLCFICKDPNKLKLVVDHNHTTGMPRKLLCHLCNNIVAQQENHPDIVRTAQEYISQHA